MTRTRAALRPPRTRPVEVIAHRGSSGEHPEHTLTACEQALADGVDGLECDVRLTRDGVLVCVHDRRVERTSNGRGIVSTLDLSELEALDFASWKEVTRAEELRAEGEAPDLDVARGRVLTLERLLQLTSSHPGVRLHIETKHPTRYGGLVERSLVELLERYGLSQPRSHESSRVQVLSFAPTALRRMRSLAPALPLQLNLERVPVRLRGPVLPGYFDVLGMSRAVLAEQPDLVERFAGRGVGLAGWTIDELGEVDRALDLGVTGIITNYPQRVLSHLRR